MQHTDTICSIMRHFAESTGLDNAACEPRRYLWTDAFAVCNFLQLYRQTEDAQFLQLALTLVDQVHLTLGKHHPDSKHSSWISGLSEQQALIHPTRGGLRIGKRLNERQANEAYDERLEWDRDGQYFHYLTKWMHALNRVSLVTGKSIYNQWALELAAAAHKAFCYTSGSGKKRMFWKMSIDLSRPLVDSMGQHDPLDGLITFLQLEATAKNQPGTPAKLSLKKEIIDMTSMCTAASWATHDPLGIGGLLGDACRLAHLIQTDHLPESNRLNSLLKDIEYSLQAYITNNPLNYAAEYRLAFRELGLSIGLHGVDKIQKIFTRHAGSFNNIDQLQSTLTKLTRFIPVAELIENFWLTAEHQTVSSWLDHADINNVMLATSLAPGGYLCAGNDDS